MFFLAWAAMLALLPVLGAVTTAHPLWRSLPVSDWAFAGTDLTMLVLAALHACLAWRTWRFTPKPVRARPPRAARAATTEVAG